MAQLNNVKRVFTTGLLVVSIASCGPNALQRQYELVGSELPGAERAAKAAGVIIDAKDLAPNPPVNPKENAWPEIKAANDSIKSKLKNVNSWWSKWKGEADNTTPESLQNVTRELAVIESELVSIEKAAQKPRVDFQRPYGSIDPLFMLFPEYAEIKGLVKLFSIRGIVMARNGDINRAESSFQTCFRLSEFAGSEPTLISGLVRIACDSITIHAMESALALSKDPKGLVAKLEGFFVSHDMEMNLLNSIRGESVSTIFSARKSTNFLREELLKNAGINGADSEDAFRLEILKLCPEGVSPKALSQAYTTRALQLYAEIMIELRKTKDPLLQSEALKRIMARFANPDDPTCAFNAYFASVFEDAGNSFARHDALNTCFESLLKVLKFKHANRRWPKTLAEAGAQATDPFDRKPMRYKVTGNEVRIYSIGPDRTDEGGSEQVIDQVSGRSRRDFAVTYPRMPKPKPGSNPSPPVQAIPKPIPE